jgi:hypothetical protein
MPFLELRPGHALILSGDTWRADVTGVGQVSISSNPKAALLLLEREPTAALINALPGFPAAELLSYALSTHSPRWIEQSVKWAVAWNIVDDVRDALRASLNDLPKSNQQARQRIRKLTA